MRTKNKLIVMRNNAVTRLKELDPTYKPPSSFNYRNAELEDRVNIPAEEYPHINFVGMLLGPRGTALEEVKTKTNTIIAIRQACFLTFFKKSGPKNAQKSGDSFFPNTVKPRFKKRTWRKQNLLT